MEFIFKEWILILPFIWIICIFTYIYECLLLLCGVITSGYRSYCHLSSCEPTSMKEIHKENIALHAKLEELNERLAMEYEAKDNLLRKISELSIQNDIMHKNINHLNDDCLLLIFAFVPKRCLMGVCPRWNRVMKKSKNHKPKTATITFEYVENYGYGKKEFIQYRVVPYTSAPREAPFERFEKFKFFTSVSEMAPNPIIIDGKPSDNDSLSVSGRFFYISQLVSLIRDCPAWWKSRISRIDFIDFDQLTMSVIEALSGPLLSTYDGVLRFKYGNETVTIETLKTLILELDRYSPMSKIRGIRGLCAEITGDEFIKFIELYYGKFEGHSTLCFSMRRALRQDMYKITGWIRDRCQSFSYWSEDDTVFEFLFVYRRRRILLSIHGSNHVEYDKNINLSLKHTFDKSLYALARFGNVWSYDQN